ncbi:MAG: N-acetyltransferase [Planctomycetota bacterium]|nr:MAG: N-acetyltransferase [Planctomycetota bacterium]
MKGTLRLAEGRDLAAINDIYNYYVLNCTCTYQLEPDTLDDRKVWFREHPPEKYPVVVAEQEGEVVGWGSLSRFRPRAGYAPTAEASIYIRSDCHRRGFGRALLADLIDRARTAGFHSIVGGASAEQTASIALQESLGFVRVARFVEVGYKFGRRLDVVYLQLMLSPEPKR